MKRILLLVAALTLFGAACSAAGVTESFEELPGSEAQPETSISVSPSKDAPVSDDAGSDDSVSDETPEPQPEGPVAPDFTLALEPSGEFVLSQEVKPVYMVFWAEW